MNEADINESHPLRQLEKEGGLADPGMSILVARTGVGKSAALINFALDLLMQGKQVLHFTAGMPSEKTHQYYKKIFTDFTRNYPPAGKRSWEDVYANFIVISYLETANMIADLEREIGTVISSARLEPALIIVDGLEIDEQTADTLQAIQRAATAHGTRILASVRIHRDTDGHVNLEGPLQLVSSHTEHIYFLEPEPSRDRIKVDRVGSNGALHAMPIYFCPHDFVFRHS
jgi:hypothetical protein